MLRTRFVAAAIVGLSALCAAGLAGAGVGKWGPPHGLYGGRITSLAIDPRNPATVYAATPYAGVFKTTDGARSWRPAKTGLERVGFAFTLAVDPRSSGTVYLGGGRLSNDTTGGVFKTTDGGRSWRKASTGLGMNLWVNVLAVDARTPGTLYAGTRNGIYKTANGGRRWVLMTDDLGSGAEVVDQAGDPHAPATVYAVTFPGSLFKSTDGGRTWRAMNAGLEKVKIVSSFIVDPRTPGTVYTSAIGFDRGDARGVFKSTDGGATWIRTSVGLGNQPVVGLAIDPRNPSILYAQTEAAMFKTADGGASWAALTRPPKGVSQVVVDPLSTNTLYVGTRWEEATVGHGVFKSIDGGRGWRAASTGLASMEPGGLAIHPRRADVLYVGTHGDGVWTSSDGGNGWRPVDVGKEWVTALEISERSPSTLYVATTPDGVLKSTNGGRTWRRANGGLANYVGPQTIVNDLAIDPRNASTVYAGAPYGIFKTMNGGRSWREMPVGRRVVNDLAIDPRDPRTVYAGTKAGGILKSTNGGGSWRPASSGLPDGGVAVLAIDPRRTATLYAGTRDAGIFKSTDGGRSWRAANDGLPQGRKVAVALAIDPRQPSTVYAVVNGDVFRSTNGGRSWGRFERGLDPRDITHLEIDSTGRVLYAGAANGEIVDFRVRS